MTITIDSDFMRTRMSREERAAKIAAVLEANRLELERTAHRRQQLELALRMSNMVVDRAMRQIRSLR